MNAAAQNDSKPADAWRQLMAEDRIVRWTLVVLVAAVVAAAPWWSGAVRFWLVAFLPVVFLVILIAALEQGLTRLPSYEEQRFWNDILFAVVARLAAALLELLPGSLSDAADLAAAALTAFAYALLLLAAERQPHRQLFWRSIRLERQLILPTVIAFVGGLFLYFVLLPLPDSAPRLGALQVVLDVYLVFRLVYLRRAAGSQRWRALYSLWTLAAAISAAGHCRLLATGATAGAWHVVFFEALPTVVLVLMVRLRQQPLALEPPPLTLRERLEDNLPGPMGQTMIVALILPSVHFLSQRLTSEATPEAAGRSVVAVLILVLGPLAAVQYQALVRELRAQKREQDEFERRQHKIERDLRLRHERRHVQDAQYAAEEKFRQVFRLCPDMIVICRADGQLTEVNTASRDLVGYGPEELIGKNVADLGILAGPEPVRDLVDRLEHDGHVEVEAALRHRSGAERWVRIAAEWVEVGSQRYVLAIFSSADDRRAADAAWRQRLELLDEAAAAISAVAADGRVVFWNASAVDLFGRTAGEVLGHGAGEIFEGLGEEVVQRSIQLYGEDGAPHARLILSAALNPGGEGEPSS